jgi:plastocyanin
VHGTVTLTGKPPRMKAPRRRKDAEVCKLKSIPHNAVVSKDGRLADVLVRIENGGVKGRFAVPSQPVVLHHKDCVYAPRISGAVAGQPLRFVNDDLTLHNVHTYKGRDSWFNKVEVKGADLITVETPDPGFVTIACDVHPWERAFMLVSDHPFFAVTREDGAYHLDDVPPGKYRVEAWHSIYGRKTAEVEVTAGKPVEVDFTYTGTEPEPPENQGELRDLF